MSSKPTFVLVPGAWHSPDTWNKVSSILEAQQYKCVRVALPSTSGIPVASLADDIKATRDAIAAETTQGRDVVVVAHSYGGMVGESAIKGFNRPKEDAASPATTSKTGYVIGLALIATGFVITGLSFIDSIGGKPPPFWVADTENGFAKLIADTRQLFYHDLPEDEGNYWVGRLEKQSLKSLMEGGEHVYAGWKDVPVWYLLTTEDRGFPSIEAQRMGPQTAKESGADVTVREVVASHSPMLSKPEETAQFIVDAAAYFAKK